MTRAEYIAWMLEEIDKLETRCDEAMIDGNDFMSMLYGENLYFMRQTLNTYKKVKSDSQTSCPECMSENERDRGWITVGGNRFYCQNNWHH